MTRRLNQAAVVATVWMATLLVFTVLAPRTSQYFAVKCSLVIALLVWAGTRFLRPKT